MRTLAHLALAALVLALLPVVRPAAAVDDGPGHLGYYRQPALHGETLVFTAEGDLWTAPLAGGAARRLTSHHGEETHPAISPDGRLVAFLGRYEGPTEVYTIPLGGGEPTRRTWGLVRPTFVGWTPGGDLVYSSRHRAGLPNAQLSTLDLETHVETAIPLSQAAEGVVTDDGTVIFTRLPSQSSATKRYRGGTARQLWRWSPKMAEAVPLTADWAGESHAPMLHDGRILHVTNRDGSMDLWSMSMDGTDFRRHTTHEAFDVLGASIHGDVIVYQHGADLRRHDLTTGEDEPIDLVLSTDLDQRRPRWVDDPMSYLTAASPSHDGSHVALTARGEVFVVPKKHGRLVHVDRDSGVRYRDATFLGERGTLVALSDEGGTLGLWTLPADGIGERERLDEATGFQGNYRFGLTVSPDGRWVVYQDRDARLWVHDAEEGRTWLADQSDGEAWNGYGTVSFSPDGRHAAYIAPARNTFNRLKLIDLFTRDVTPLTSDRTNAASPTWSPDGAWLWFLADRHFETLVPGPWGHYQPEPFLHRQTRIFGLALTDERRSPFLPPDELGADAPADDEDAADTDESHDTSDADAAPGDDETADTEDEQQDAPPPPLVLDDLDDRLIELPLPPGEYASLQAGKEHLFWTERSIAPGSERTLEALKVGHDDPKPATIAEGITSFLLSADRSSMLVRRGRTLAIVPARGSKIDVDEGAIDLGRWRFPLDPQEEWAQMFRESWRLMREWFYDPGMHGVNWPAILERYQPLVARVGSRDELNDLIAQMVGELSALHVFVRGGDLRTGDDRIGQGHLGARLTRDAAAGGYRIEHVHRADPEFPEERGPLDAPHLDVRVGDVITHVNGEATLDVRDIGELLRDQAGREVRLRLERGEESFEAIVEPISTGAAADLRYDEWEHERRRRVEQAGDGRLGYVHLRAMGAGNYAEWARHYSPVWNRPGLIIDVRHNRGGNIDSWILSRLLRQRWMYWTTGQSGRPSPNMQYAFDGHVVVLCNEYTASDGEAFAEGFRRLGLGPVLGTRTWGGEIWLTSGNVLVDQGVATAPEFGVFGPEGEWLIEGHGVEPDIVVDNLPHATWEGDDAQLDAAIELLLERIAEDPPARPDVPPFPDFSIDGR